MPVLTVLQEKNKQEIPFRGERLLSDLLAEGGYTVPHPCGGRGTCKKCMVQLNGTRVLACRTVVTEYATVVLPTREVIASVTGGEQTARLTEHMCLGLDIGTTTLALALVSLDEKAIVRTVTAANPQRTFGADVISRIDYAAKNGISALRRVLLEEVKQMVSSLLSSVGLNSVGCMYVAGNTTMLHLFFGEDCASLGVSPYTPVFLEERKENGSFFTLDCVEEVVSLPGISAFVGADIVAGIGYVGASAPQKYRILLDLGTNAEIALFGEDILLCTAAAAGPCFEGANISCGMPAREGAVCAYSPQGECSVIGGGDATGICATGLIDVIAEWVRKGEIDETGFLEEDPKGICENVFLTGRDIREFQLAKSAIRAAMECLLQRAGLSFDQVEGLYVAGGFSAGLNIANTAYIGMIPAELSDRVKGINNSSLLGLVKHACSRGDSCPDLTAAQYVDLSADNHFSDLFMEYMMFD